VIINPLLFSRAKGIPILAPYGTIVGTGKGRDGEEVLYGHISKGNPQWKYFKEQNV
jgi:predicted FMN-binding regulatory protein PaiB